MRRRSDGMSFSVGEPGLAWKKTPVTVSVIGVPPRIISFLPMAFGCLRPAGMFSGFGVGDGLFLKQPVGLDGRRVSDTSSRRAF